MAISGMEELLDPSFTEGIDRLELADVRARRDRVQEAADVLSYLRRMVQGRLDLVLAEHEARTSGQRADLAELVERLKRGEIIADGTRSPGLGRLAATLEPADTDGWIAAELDQILDANRLGALPDLSEADLAAAVEGLSGLERRVSDQRGRLLDLANRLQEEIVRRYKTGEASVDTLLG